MTLRQLFMINKGRKVIKNDYSKNGIFQADILKDFTEAQLNIFFLTYAISNDIIDSDFVGKIY
uniref:Uncharacterized protein n=1 Tax=Strongyloides papillosus TaxID=174720 RepID=A0A0N5BT44_STREA